MKLTRLHGSEAFTHHFYDPKTKVMTVKFASGHTYQANNIPPEVSQAFLDADSKGGHWHKSLKTKFEWSEV